MPMPNCAISLPAGVRVPRCMAVASEQAQQQAQSEDDDDDDDDDGGDDVHDNSAPDGARPAQHRDRLASCQSSGSGRHANDRSSSSSSSDGRGERRHRQPAPHGGHGKSPRTADGHVRSPAHRGAGHEVPTVAPAVQSHAKKSGSNHNNHDDTAAANSNQDNPMDTSLPMLRKLTFSRRGSRNHSGGAYGTHCGRIPHGDIRAEDLNDDSDHEFYERDDDHFAAFDGDDGEAFFGNSDGEDPDRPFPLVGTVLHGQPAATATKPSSSSCTRASLPLPRKRHRGGKRPKRSGHARMRTRNDEPLPRSGAVGTDVSRVHDAKRHADDAKTRLSPSLAWRNEDAAVPRAADADTPAHARLWSRDDGTSAHGHGAWADGRTGGGNGGRGDDDDDADYWMRLCGWNMDKARRQGYVAAAAQTQTQTRTGVVAYGTAAGGPRRAAAGVAAKEEKEEKKEEHARRDGDADACAKWRKTACQFADWKDDYYAIADALHVLVAQQQALAPWFDVHDRLFGKLCKYCDALAAQVEAGSVRGVRDVYMRIRESLVVCARLARSLHDICRSSRVGTREALQVANMFAEHVRDGLVWCKRLQQHLRSARPH